MKKYTLEQLRAFAATVEEGSFSAAGRKLGKPQSVISTHIQYLEAELGYDLFDRTGRYPALTSRGMALVEDVKHLMTQHERLERISENLLVQPDFRYSIAIEDIAANPQVEKALVLFSDLYPESQLEMYHPTSNEVVEMVASGQCQVGLVCGELETAPASLQIKSLRSVTLKAYVAADHPLALQDKVTTQDLLNHRQITVKSRHGDEQYRISRNVWFNESFSNALKMTQRGLGWSLQDEEIIDHYFAPGQFVKLNTPPLPVNPTLEVNMVWKDSSNCLVEHLLNSLW